MMITSIVLTGMHNIGVSSAGKIKLGDKLVGLKEIPFVRYRFEKYGAEEIEFIRKNKAKFVGPVHLAEITLDSETAAVIQQLDTIENIAKFVYINIANDSSELKPDVIENLALIKDSYYDRLMLRDKNSLLYPLLATKIKNLLTKHTEFRAKEIGVCGSTFSFKSDNTETGDCCLTALKARELMAQYAESDDIIIPSASHESMTCCGCIKYIVVNNNIAAPESKEKHKNTKADNSGKAKNPNGSVTVKPKGVTRIDCL